MAKQPSKLQLAQWGKESVYGTAVAADKRLKSLFVDIGYNILEEDEEGNAFKSITGSIIGKEYATVDVRGKAAYNDLLYLFPMLYCAPVITTPTDGILTRRWTFNPSMTAEDTFNSMTLQKGIAGDVSIVAGLRMNDLSLAFDPGKASVALTAKGFGKTATDGQSAFTASPTLINPYSISGKHIGMYIGTAAGSITTRIKPLMATYNISGRHTPVMTLDDTEDCFEDTVENGFAPGFRIVVPKGSDSNGYLADLRSSEKKFLKIECIGPQIESVGSGPTVYYHRLEISMPINFRQPSREDQQDVHCAVFDAKAIYDATFAGTSKVVIDSELTAL
jgi:hypothetical protein